MGKLDEKMDPLRKAKVEKKKKMDYGKKDRFLILDIHET